MMVLADNIKYGLQYLWLLMMVVAVSQLYRLLLNRFIWILWLTKK